MKSNKALIAVVVIILIIAGVIFWRKAQQNATNNNLTNEINQVNTNSSESTPTPEGTPTPEATPTPRATPSPITATPVNTEKTSDTSTPSVKEFSITSFYELVDNQPKTQFSLKEITVKKGDRVRIKVTNTKGVHDFKLDEYNIFKETPLNEEVVIEFTADKAGEFIYYCSKPNHRQWGQWGTLRVTE